MNDATWVSMWRSLVMTFIDLGYVRLSVLEKEALRRGWKGKMIAEVAQALNVEPFEHDGEMCWRLSDKVVPILPNRNRSQQTAAQA